MRVGPEDGIGVLTKRGRYQNSDPQEHMRMGKWPSANQEEEPTRTQRDQLWDLGNPEPQGSEEQGLCLRPRPPRAA